MHHAWKGSNWHHDWKVVDDTSRWFKLLFAYPQSLKVTPSNHWVRVTFSLTMAERTLSQNYQGHQLRMCSNGLELSGTFPILKQNLFHESQESTNLLWVFDVHLCLLGFPEHPQLPGKTNPTCFNWVLKKNTTIRSETCTQWWKTHGRCLARSDRRVTFFWRRLGSPFNLKQNDEGDVLGDDFVESYYVIHSRWEWDAWQGFFLCLHLVFH